MESPCPNGCATPRVPTVTAQWPASARRVLFDIRPCDSLSSFAIFLQSLPIDAMLVISNKPCPIPCTFLVIDRSQSSPH
jgi:hypothetical protein